MNQVMMETLEGLRDLKDKGLLLSPTREHTGLTCPSTHKLIRCNMDTVVTMEWDPIGEWAPTENQVLKLRSKQCGLTLYKTNGMKIHIGFQEGDYRYQVDNWLVMYAQRKMEVSKIF